MIIFKYMILVVLFACSCCIGFLMSRKFNNRVEELREFKNIINILEAKIKFTYEPLGDIFNEISKMTKDKKSISNIFQMVAKNMQVVDVSVAWEEALDNSKLYLSLNDEDINIIKSLGKLLR